MSAADMTRAIRRIGHEVIERHRGASGLLVMGIHTRGVYLADQLARTISDLENLDVPVGELDVGAFRDDLHRRPPPPPARTHSPVPVDDAEVIMVDDVLYTGRTARAAMDALNELGRPARIELAVMIDRGHRQLPIRPDYVGKNIPTSVSERVTVKVAPVDVSPGVWVER